MAHTSNPPASDQAGEVNPHIQSRATASTDRDVVQNVAGAPAAGVSLVDLLMHHVVCGKHAGKCKSMPSKHAVDYTSLNTVISTRLASSEYDI